jgi:hypothetical protein
MNVLAALLLFVTPATSTAPAQSENPRASETLVMPFENPQSEPRLYWLGEASAVLLTHYLAR